jgi:hypothetical protein
MKGHEGIDQENDPARNHITGKSSQAPDSYPIILQARKSRTISFLSELWRLDDGLPRWKLGLDAEEDLEL